MVNSTLSKLKSTVQISPCYVMCWVRALFLTVIQKPADEVNLLKTIRKSFRLKKKVQMDPQQQGKGSEADHTTHSSTPMERRWTTSGKSSPSTGKRRSTYVPIK